MITIVKKSNQYMKPSGPVFVYIIKGSAEELKDYKAVQGDNYRESDAKEPLFFSRTVLTSGQELLKTRAGRFVITTDLEAESQKAAELEQAELAKLKAMQKFTGLTPAQIVKLVMAA